MVEYPKVLYKAGGEEIVFGHNVTTIIVEDAQAEKDAADFVEAELFIAAMDDEDDDSEDAPKRRGRPRKAVEE